jgi:hypothetical protein
LAELRSSDGLRGGDLVEWETEVAKCKQTKGWLDDYAKMKAELLTLAGAP